MKLMISALVARQNARMLFGRKSSERVVDNMISRSYGTSSWSVFPGEMYQVCLRTECDIPIWNLSELIDSQKCELLTLQMAGGYSQVHECVEGCIKKLKMTMEGTTTSGAFTGATLAEKLNKLNSSQQSIESIFLKCIHFMIFLVTHLPFVLASFIVTTLFDRRVFYGHLYFYLGSALTTHSSISLVYIPSQES